jgi:hypothetical protein
MRDNKATAKQTWYQQSFTAENKIVQMHLYIQINFYHQ